ncbi:MAG TPA: hypothetical protein VMW48_01680, partial [Vicinamibacterales bacterium]|nr:hypothetical protein [Vicinamibacterales bacterium]
MGNATSLFSLMRNLGGSIGIAVTATMLSRKQNVYGSVLGEYVTAYSQAARATLEGARAAFIAAGLDPVTATQRAYAATAGIVHRQAAMLSFVDVFRMLGVMFLCLLPLVLLMNRPGTNKH